jgi:pyruvate formate lyase activating enzyme
LEFLWSIFNGGIPMNINDLTREGQLYEKLPDQAVRCYACAHRCLIKEGRQGICKVRFNESGILFAPWGYVSALNADPVEKKPFYHFMPGSTALTFGMLGCDFHCDYCQNWQISQVGRSTASKSSTQSVHTLSPEQIVEFAVRSGAKVIASSYNEPLITSEWAASVFEKARDCGIDCAYISNGNATRQVLEYLRPHLSAYKIDLKTMQDRQYRKLGGVLQHVLDAIEMVYSLGIWLEVVTLIVPGFNDSTEELTEAARYIASVSPSIPWHVTAFHPDYKMTEPSRTGAETLIRAAEIGLEAGLHYVYAGNLPGMVSEYENTYCQNCRSLLIERRGFSLRSNKIDKEGACPSCHTRVPGIWVSNR